MIFIDLCLEYKQVSQIKGILVGIYLGGSLW